MLGFDGSERCAGAIDCKLVLCRRKTVLGSNVRLARPQPPRSPDGVMVRSGEGRHDCAQRLIRPVLLIRVGCERRADWWSSLRSATDVNCRKPWWSLGRDHGYDPGGDLRSPLRPTSSSDPARGQHESPGGTAHALCRSPKTTTPSSGAWNCLNFTPASSNTFAVASSM